MKIKYRLSSSTDNIFRFKQFSVDQTGCAMKVNTDGVLLGVLSEAGVAGRVLDIGTGTGVIALILAQRMASANIKAIEIDQSAAITARRNFERSIFNSRLEILHTPFEDFFKGSKEKFDLIVSNPPFFIDSLKSDDQFKGIARHTDQIFFENLMEGSALHLTDDGLLELIVPVRLSETLQALGRKSGLILRQKISICSFPDSLPHREILVFAFRSGETALSRFVIYNKPKEYSMAYQEALKDFFTIF